MNWVVIDSVASVLHKSSYFECCEVARVLNAIPSDVSEEDEVKYEDILRNVTSLGKARVVDTDTIEFVKDTYFKIYKKDLTDPCVVYCYENPDDNNQLSLAFSPHDGAAILPVWDIPKDTIKIPLRFLTMLK